ncbi:C2H2 finger domain protein [Aspergillus novoparasiticus]|uniref:C2H2 finger domain protein n=1 Tax=Aspergillus novoparasiticus TaxID=986946 RepID=A0A5N6E807_9EURO|nr:C2H2 finger domain protein [Aspergillus novoparasiticus]
MRRRRETSASSRTAITESSTTSPGITDDDRSVEPNSETDLTEPEYLPSPSQKVQKKKTRRGPTLGRERADFAEFKVSETENIIDVSAVEVVHQGRYEDPADDTDEDLSKVPEDYGKSNNTRKLNLRLEERWARYCRTKAIEPSADPKWEDPEEALRQASPNDIHRFLNWCLKLKYGLDGRRLKGYRKASALEADWKYFRVYYTKVTKQEMSKEMGEAVRTVPCHLPCGQGMRHLIDKRGLDKQPRANVPVYVEDMVPFNETILQTQERRFHLGFQRILLCLYNTIGLFTVNRKQAMLHLQFKHLQISLQRDPHGGPPVPMIEIEPQFVKSVLGMSKVNTFTLPEIIYGVSLVFSPHVLLFSILFYVNAFEAPHLTSMEDLRRLFIEDGRQEMPLPLKKEMDSYYVFPKVDVIDGEPRILWETRMNGSTLDGQLRSFSEIHGFLNHFFSHQFRYGGGELLDQSGFVSEAQRNVIMAHASSRTFIKHYRPRRHTGLQEVMCGVDPDEELSRAVTRMSRWIDKRRPRILSDAEKASVEKDPELQSAIQWHAELEDRYARSNDPTLRALLEQQERGVENTRRRLREKRRKEIRRDFSRKQAVIDIERQLTGGAVNDEPAREVLRKEFAMPPEQILLVETFFTWPTSDALEDEWLRRNKAVAAGTQYCSFREGGPLRGRPKRPASDDATQVADPLAKKQKMQERPTVSAWEKKLGSVKEKVTADKPSACFQCLKEYSDVYGVKRHFKTLHLKDRKCNFCDLSLQHEMHLRSHAQEVHRLRT